MTDYYVETGITGSITSRLTSCCCQNGAHVNFSGWANALDVATHNRLTQRIEIAPSSNIRSIKTFVNPTHGCSDSDCWSYAIDNTVKVELWTGSLSGGQPTGTKIGGVLYVHADDIAVANNTAYNISGHKALGWTPDRPVDPPGGATCYTCRTCYTGHHVHMQSDTGASLNPGTTDCHDVVNCCGTNLYKWTV